ncbi:MAG: hypothetical protein R3E39_10615 [Anaerolineae bacterium]
MVFSEMLADIKVARTEELVFAGDGVRLAGQIDYPLVSSRQTTFPLLFILHNASCNDRDGYRHFADAGLDAGYAVFRWDKRGTGRSGAGGRGSTTQDAVNAYEIALEQPGIDRKHVIILAQGAGTGLLATSFGLFARVQHPYGVVLARNMLDERDVLAIDSRLLVLMGQNDWNPWQQYGKAVCEVHNKMYRHGAQYYVAPYADAMLIDPRTEKFHYGTNNTLQDWLRTV